MEEKKKDSDLCTPRDLYWLNITIERLLFTTEDPEYLFNRVTEGLNEKVKSDLRKFVLLYPRENSTRAEDCIRNLAQKYKSNITVLLFALKYYSNYNIYDNKIICSRRIYTLNKNFKPVWADALLGLTAKRKYDEAMTLANRMMKEDGGDDNSAEIMIDLYALTNRIDEAMDFIENYKWNSITRRKFAYAIYYLYVEQTDDFEVMFESIKDELTEVEVLYLEENLERIKKKGKRLVLNEEEDEEEI